LAASRSQRKLRGAVWKVRMLIAEGGRGEDGMGASKLSAR
jgi:hypothetical protein